MEEIIQKAIEGGWRNCGYEEIHRCSFLHCNHCGVCNKNEISVEENEYVLDPLFRQALGINPTEGWSKAVEYLNGIIK